MIARLTGEIAHVGTDRVIIDVAGVGYVAQMGALQLQSMEAGSTITLHVSTQFQKEVIQLYAFSSLAEQEIFEQLISVPNIGPKLGLALLGHLSLEQLTQAIESQDTNTLASTPGVGKRTAQRIAMELQGKLPTAFLPTAEGTIAAMPSATDALPLALSQLGYRKSEIDKAVSGLSEYGLTDATLEERLSASLKILSGASP